MKEASGELNMTLITMIAIAAIAGIFLLFKDPIIDLIETNWESWTGQDLELNPEK